MCISFFADEEFLSSIQNLPISDILNSQDIPDLYSRYLHDFVHHLQLKPKMNDMFEVITIIEVICSTKNSNVCMWRAYDYVSFLLTFYSSDSLVDYTRRCADIILCYVNK